MKKRKRAKKSKSGGKRVVFLEGKRLYLRPPQESDIPLMVRWINDPEVSKFVSVRYPMTEIGERRWLEELAKRGNDVVLVIVLKAKTPAQDRPIGVMGIHGIHRENGTATTGASIGEKDCWGNGYGTEAKMLLLGYAFNTLNLYKIYSRVYDFNKRSYAYSEKCGYKLEATLPGDQFRFGRRISTHILAVYADAWRTLWEKTKKKYLPEEK